MARRQWMAAGVGLGVLIAYLGTQAPELTPRADWDRDLAYQITDPVWLQLILPVPGGPDSWAPAGILARTWALLPASWSLNVLSSWLMACTAGLLALLVSHRAGTAAGAAAALGFALSPAVWSAAVAAEGSVQAGVLAAAMVTSLVSLSAYARSAYAPLLMAGAGVLALAMAEDVAFAILLVPLLWVGATRAPHLRQRSLVAGAAAFALAVIVSGWALAHLVRTGTDVPPAVGLVEAAVEMWRWGIPPHLTPADVVSARASALGVLLLENLGPFGLVITLLGLSVSPPVLILAVAAGLAIVCGPATGPWDPGVRGILLLAVVWGLNGMAIGRVSAWVPAGGRAVAVALCCLLPALQIMRTGAGASTLLNRPAGRLLEALVTEPVEARALVAESPRFSRLLSWANQRVDPSARIELVPHDPARLERLIEEGRTMLATESAAARLSLSGFDGPSVSVGHRSLEDLLSSTDRGALVGLVSTARAFEVNPAAWPAAATLLGAGAAAGPPAHPLAILARRSHDVVQSEADPSGVDLAAFPGAGGLDSGLVPRDGVRLAADGDGARLEVADRELAFVADGALYASWAPPDEAVEWAVLRGRERLTAPWQIDGWGFSRLTRRQSCVEVTSRQWSDASALASAARLGLSLPRGSRMRLYLARDRPLSIRAAAFPGRLDPEAQLLAWDRANPEHEAVLRAALAADSVESEAVPATARFIWQLHVGASDLEPALVAIGMGGAPDWIQARLETGATTEAGVLCAGVSGARLFDRDGVREETVSVVDADSFGAGWLPAEHAGRERWRLTNGRESDVYVRLDTPLALAVGVTARPAAAAEAPAARWGLRVNGTALDTHPLEAGESTYRWTVPAHLWRAGTNTLTLVRSGAPGAPMTEAGALPDLRVTAIRLRPSTPSAP